MERKESNWRREAGVSAAPRREERSADDRSRRTASPGRPDPRPEPDERPGEEAGYGYGV